MVKNAALILLSTIALTILLKTMSKPTLKHFKPNEFGLWWPMMNNDLLRKLDAFREAWGGPVIISSAQGGIGREDETSESQHNVLKWGDVRAVDVFPMIQNDDGTYSYMQTAYDRHRAYNAARDVGFTGIGLYTDTMPGNMLHVDVRSNRTASNPATWSRVDGEYLGIGEVLV